MTKRRKHKHARWILPLALLMCIGALLGVLLYLQKEEEKASSGDAAPREQITLFACERSDIAAVRITPPSGQSYTLLVRDGALTIPGEADFPIRSLLEESIFSVICKVVAEEAVLDTSLKVTDLAAFGLDVPRVSASVTMQDQSVHTLRIGDSMQLGIPYRYFMWDEDPVIYAISADVYDAFSYDLAALHDVQQPVWDYTLWDKVILSGENTRILTRTDLGWQMDAPYAYPLDSAAAESFLSSVESIAFASYVADAQDADLAAYGLDTPRLTLTMQQAATKVDYYDETYTLKDTLLLPEEEITLYFGDQVDDYYVYCMYLDTVYTATLFQTGFLWNGDALELMDKTPLDVPVSALSRLTVTQENETWVYDISLTEQLEPNGDLKMDENGNTLWDVHVQKDGQAMDTDAFLTWYAALQQCAPGNTVPTEFESTESLLTIHFEGTQVNRTAAFMPLDALHTALAVNGTALYYFADTALSSILQLP